MHISNNNQYTKYTMNNSELSKDNHEKYLGITISNEQVNIAQTLLRKLVGFIGRNFEYKSEKKSNPYTM